MKKIILTLVALLAMTATANAQAVWKMVVTQTDGTQQQINVLDIKNVTYTADTLADKNVDQLIIKELYNGGCPRNTGTSYFQMDKGFILYNNCPEEIVVNNLCVGFLDPYNGHGINDWLKDGSLSYADSAFIPVTDGIWYFQQPVVLQPYSQIVVSCMGAIDNTQTYTQSVNYANKDYYTMYDPESGYSMTSYYPTPSDVIPTSHYLKATRIGQSTAWPLSVTSPALVIFQAKGVTPNEFASNPDNITYSPGRAHTPTWACLRVPNSWVIDGIEVYQASKVSMSTKRLTSDIDAGYVTLTNRLGHTLYRNVDANATKAISGNSDKLVYNYSLGVGTSTDPNSIDAEASIKNGAKIVYMDTNNSTNDFHERQKFSVRGE